MKKISWFFLLFTLLLLQSCNNTTKDKTVKDDTIQETPPVTINTPPKITETSEAPLANPYELFKGEAMAEMLEFDAKGMDFGMIGNNNTKDSIRYTYFDVDFDGDDDLFLQVFFQKNDKIVDAILFYFNNEDPEFDDEFKRGFSLEHYHRLGQHDYGQPLPCTSCTFQKREEDIFTFIDRTPASKGQLLQYKLTIDKYKNIWKKVK